MGNEWFDQETSQEDELLHDDLFDIIYGPSPGNVDDTPDVVPVAPLALQTPVPPPPTIPVPIEIAVQTDFPFPVEVHIRDTLPQIANRTMETQTEGNLNVFRNMNTQTNAAETKEEGVQHTPIRTNLRTQRVSQLVKGYLQDSLSIPFNWREDISDIDDEDDEDDGPPINLQEGVLWEEVDLTKPPYAAESKAAENVGVDGNTWNNVFEVDEEKDLFKEFEEDEIWGQIFGNPNTNVVDEVRAEIKPYQQHDDGKLEVKEEDNHLQQDVAETKEDNDDDDDAIQFIQEVFHWERKEDTEVIDLTVDNDVHLGNTVVTVQPTAIELQIERVAQRLPQVIMTPGEDREARPIYSVNQMLRMSGKRGRDIKQEMIDKAEEDRISQIARIREETQENDIVPNQVVVRAPRDVVVVSKEPRDNVGKRGREEDNNDDDNVEVIRPRFEPSTELVVHDDGVAEAKEMEPENPRKRNAEKEAYNRVGEKYRKLPLLGKRERPTINEAGLKKSFIKNKKRTPFNNYPFVYKKPDDKDKDDTNPPKNNKKKK